MRLGQIQKWLVPFWKNEWRVAVTCKVWDWMQIWPDKALERILALNNKLVCFDWDFSWNPDVFTIINWLVNAWYEIVYSTDAWDEVWSMVRLRNLILSIKVNIPEEGKQTNFLPHVLNYVQEKDELRFEINSKEDYKKFRDFEKTMNIIRPSIVLEVNKEFQTGIESIIKDELIGLDRIIIKYK